MMKNCARPPRCRWRGRLIPIAVTCLLPTISLLMLGTMHLREDNTTLFGWRAGQHFMVKKTANTTLPINTTTPTKLPACDKCCYRYTTITKDVLEILSESELKKKGCEKRLPGALIIGVKKCGTTALRNFLSYHPDIACSQRELKFFSSSDRERGLEFYRSEMLYSTPDQVSVEKTPAYSLFPNVQVVIKRLLPNVKLLVIMRDPVQRAISDYVHIQASIVKYCLKTTTMPKNATLRESCDSFDIYKINDTFEDSVINSAGDIQVGIRLVSAGVYVQDMRRFLKYFKREQILAIDGEAFIKNPYPAVKLVERFLGIRDYFTPDHFYYDTQKGFFCLNKPIPKNCMREAKGRPHPEVNDETLKKLRDYYRPYNKALNELMKVDFRWSS